MDMIHDLSVSNDSLLCCRACLATDARLFNIHDYKLSDAFYHIVGSFVYKHGPQYLCSFCSASLLRCEAFRSKCLRAQQCLNSKEHQGELDTDYIRTIDRSSHKLLLNLTTNPVQTLECVNLKPPEDIKNEPDVENIKITDSKKTDFKIEVEINEDKLEQVFLVTDIDDDNDTNTRKRKSKKKIKTEDDDFDYDGMDIDFDDNDDVTLENIAKSLKKGKVKKKVVKKKREGKKEKKVKEKPVRELKIKRRNPANGYLPEFAIAAFENMYSVHVVTLSKEDQLEEIAMRKESANYQESAFQCEDCGKGFVAEESYNNHRARHSPSAGNFPCEICKVRFTKQSIRHTHQDMHRLKFFCKECSFVSRTRHQAKQHHEMHVGKLYECQHCGKTFSKSSTYLSHVRLAHPALNVACDECGETFVGQMGLKMHKKRKHAQSKPEQYKCEICSATFLNMEALSRHAAAAGDHGALNPCEQCGENCASETALSKHIAEMHPADSHRCEECDASFASAAAYDLHHRRKHLNQPFSAAGRRTLHREPSVPGQFVCEQCGRILPSRTSLRYHKRDHKTAKPHACRQCPKSFSTKRALDWHIRSHTGEKPHQCPDCPLAFSIKSNLKRHHKAVHLGLRNSVPCSICGRVFTTNSCVRIHINTVHHGQPGPKRNRKRTKYGKIPESPASLI
ncbi:zinc finger protein 883-like isoform X2 [Leguminivora glycinivorella]|uniref:zinc finger protein 883-like isoform X2 n=1 Tax=Leguminivora glycinivorella TaxID=1035111 RepID=UPI00200FE766|nr:zinc finger protein 883-like isoform X2 [Leguminivora glycinivorella]